MVLADQFCRVNKIIRIIIKVELEELVTMTSQCYLCKNLNANKKSKIFGQKR